MSYKFSKFNYIYSLFIIYNFYLIGSFKIFVYLISNKLFMLMLLGMSNGLKINVCKKSKNGIYKGQLVKVESALNGGNYKKKKKIEYYYTYL